MADGSFDPKDFLIPKHIFHPECPEEDIPQYPCCPVLVFINSRSGGQLGGDLLQTYVKLLNEYQVIDLGKQAPENVLQNVFGNLERLKHMGDELAVHILDKLNLIVAGGDGTAGWLLGVVCDLRLPTPPPVATVPLGTGNNLPFAFGWGKKNPGTDRHSVISFLEQVKKADRMNIDNWHLVMRMKEPKEGSCDPLAPLELPHSLHVFNRVSSSDSLNKEGYHTYRGGFWNYFSIGMDAQVSFAFHSERKLHPERFKNQLVNQGTYLKLGLAQGVLSHDSSGNISQIADIDVIQKAGGDWERLEVPNNIKSVICLNLPSFSGGLNPWGTPRPKYRQFTPPYVDDGRIEVVGFKDAWQGLLVISGGHGTRLAQVHRIRFKFHKGVADHTYMRMDGEPWKQPLPKDEEHDEEVVVEISHHGQVTMLAVPNCRSKCMPRAHPVAPGSPSAPLTSTIDDDSDDESGERRKFGAAETFKYPEEIDISHLA